MRVSIKSVSEESAQEKLYPKLIRSYAMDALVRREAAQSNPSPEKARAFVEEILNCREMKYQSVGQGWDYRYDDKTVIGMALIFQDKVIHMVYFRKYDSRMDYKSWTL